MRAHITLHALHKGGTEPHEYEDAAWVGSSAAAGPDRGMMPPPGPACRRGEVGRVATVRAAVSDGAADSLLARRWAETLVRRAGAAPTRLLRGGADFADLLGQAADRWPELMRRYELMREARGRPLAWYERPGFERGAHATLLVAHFAAHRWAPGCGTWSAAALGDSCLFHVRGDRLRVAFPVTRAADFGTTPALAASGGQDHAAAAARAHCVHGRWLLGDRFYLATDAMAAWFLRRTEHGGKPWAALRALDSAAPGDLARWVERQRKAGELRNDDVTIIRIEPR
ncbi:hypothetical protein LO772_09605 [Yinghuangia sp. ASG 101]|uniref:hypothetical protein n=1 Tax=Yinghuangia sp. ASG 101 TaxID=2896848 RepID=UPI001E53D21B|nr:hypothetical protein [Yinghuangia sp. ASG 101]UGQ13819.1 hypothetical protein LO772_09605 [Yinghuangia sp. ASG 101]